MIRQDALRKEVRSEQGLEGRKESTVGAKAEGGGHGAYVGRC